MIKVFVYNLHYYVDGVPIDFNCEVQNEKFR